MANLTRTQFQTQNTTRYTKQSGETDPYIFPEDHIALGADVAESAEMLLEGASVAEVGEAGIQFDAFKGYNYNTGQSYASKTLVLNATAAIAGARALLQWTPATGGDPTLVGDIPASVINRQELLNQLVLGVPNWVKFTCLSVSPFLVIGELVDNTALRSTSSVEKIESAGVVGLHVQRKIIREAGGMALAQNTNAYHNAVIIYLGAEDFTTIPMPGFNGNGNGDTEAGRFFRITFYVEIGVTLPGTGEKVMLLQFNPLDTIYDNAIAGIPADEVNTSGGNKFLFVPEGQMITLIRYKTAEPVTGVSSGYEWFVEDRRMLTTPEKDVTTNWIPTAYNSIVSLNLAKGRRFHTEANGPISLVEINNIPETGFDLVYEVMAISTGVTMTVTDLPDYGWTEQGLTTPIAVPNGSKLELVISQRPGDLITVTWKIYTAAVANEPPIYSSVVLTGQYIGDTFQLTGSFSDPQNRSEDTSVSGSQMDLLVFASDTAAQDFLDNDGDPANATSLVSGPLSVGGSPTLSYTAQPGDASKYFVGGFLAKANNGNNAVDTEWRFSSIEGPVVAAPSGVLRSTLYTGPFVQQAWSSTPYSQTVTITGFAAPGTNRRAVLKVWGEGGAPGTLNVADATATLGGQAMPNRQNNFFNDGAKQFAIVFDLPDANIPADGNVSLSVTLPFTPQLMIVQLDLLTNTSQALPTQVQKGNFQAGEGTVGFSPEIVAAASGMILSLLTTANSGETVFPLNGQTMSTLNIASAATAHTAQVLVPAGTYSYDFNVNGTAGTSVQVFYPIA